MSQSRTAARLKHVNKVVGAEFRAETIWYTVATTCIVRAHTVEGVVSRMHLAELCHVPDWMTTGRGGAYAGLASDPCGFQSAKNQTQRGSQHESAFFKEINPLAVLAL